MISIGEEELSPGEERESSSLRVSGQDLERNVMGNLSVVDNFDIRVDVTLFLLRKDFGFIYWHSETN